jgi:hypothetical protein
MCFCDCHCFDGFSKEMVLFVTHGAFVLENTLSVAVCVLGRTKENSKMISKFVVKWLHFTQTLTP